MPSTPTDQRHQASHSTRKLAGKLALGTVQFGLAYGVSNERGRVPADEASAILREAMEQGVRTIDTAEAYGESEAVVGGALRGLPGVFDIVTKFPGRVTADELPDHLSRSLDRLRTPSVSGYLAHDPTALLDPKLVSALTHARDKGLIAGFGASVYHPRELETILELGVDIDIVQIPYSIVDQRFAPVLLELRRQGVTVHARSVYLQGLLLMDPDHIPMSLEEAASTVSALRAEASARDCPLNALLLGFALHEEAIDRVVVGVTSLEEFRSNISALESASLCRLPLELAKSFAISDESLIIPSNWKRPAHDTL